jgi:hypothetical protein
VKASNTEAWDSFGTSGLAIDGNTLAVGAPEEDSCATGVNGDQTNNSCGVLMVHIGPGPDPVPSPNGGSGAVYVYVMQ